MGSIREPAVAGMFYPGDAQELRHQVADFLDHAGEPRLTPKALIAPHAGYVYSGPIAANAYAQLAPLRDTIKRVVLLGPAHRYPLRGLAYSEAALFRTPLGDVPVDQDALRSLDDLPQVRALDAAFEGEHCLEVQLPFLQLVLDDFKLIPLVVGDATDREVAEVLQQLWAGPETLIVISSDLSHYHDYPTARKMDKATSEAIVGLHPEAIGYEDACGRIPVKGLLNLARQQGLIGELIDLRNSGDTAGPRDQVVGYGAYAFLETSTTA